MNSAKQRRVTIGTSEVIEGVRLVRISAMKHLFPQSKLDLVVYSFMIAVFCSVNLAMQSAFLLAMINVQACS